MSTVRYPIRLYASHDLDLVTFTLTHEFDIRSAMYSALKAFARGEAFIITIPPSVRELPELRRVYSKSLSLDTEKDADAISILNKIVPGKRNNFLKNLLRLYLAYPFSECFFEDETDQAEFEQKLSGIRSGRKKVRAGKKRVNQKTELSSLPGSDSCGKYSSKNKEDNKKRQPVNKNEAQKHTEKPQSHIPDEGTERLKETDLPGEESVSPEEEDAIFSLFENL